MNNSHCFFGYDLVWLFPLLVLLFFYLFSLTLFRFSFVYLLHLYSSSVFITILYHKKSRSQKNSRFYNKIYPIGDEIQYKYLFTNILKEILSIILSQILRTFVTKSYHISSLKDHSEHIEVPESVQFLMHNQLRYYSIHKVFIVD